MKIEEIAKQLKGKRKSVSDLARFISTQTDHNPNYTILLGAGCSISSGVNTATDLTREWRKELCGEITDVEAQRLYLKQEHGDWYDPNREYSSLFERKYDLQRQRRMFVEKEVSGKTPSLGYAYLTALVNQNYFNTIFTTNFDDLINEAFYSYSDQRPIVCAHDSSINSITVTSKRPKIIKLHGDYLFDDLKSTARETESLEQNMKRKFAEFSKDYGLIVTGYSGGDRSIMDTLTSLLKSDEYFKNGIYWCIRKDSEVSEELRKLLWKEKVYFVEIDGFDEFLAELYHTTNKGEALPFSTISVSRRPAEIVRRLLSLQDKFPTESPILKKAREELVKQSKRATLVDMVYRPETEEFNNDEKSSDDELITQLEITNLIESGNYREAVAKGRAVLQEGINIRPVARRRMLTLIIQAHRYLEELNEAIRIVEELISFQPHNAANYLLKSNLTLDRFQKIAVVEKAIEVNPYFARSYYEKAFLYAVEARSSYGDDRKNAVIAAHEAIKMGLVRDPSIHNPCWSLKFNLIKEFQKDEQACDTELNKIVHQLCEMNPNEYIVLNLRAKMLSEKDMSKLEVLLEDIDRIKKRSEPRLRARLDIIRLESIATGNNTEQIANALSMAELDHDLAKNPELAVVVGELKRKKLGLDNDAIILMENCLKVGFDDDVVELLVSTLIELGRQAEAEKTFSKWRHRLPLGMSSRLHLDILEGRKDFDGVLSELRKPRTPSEKNYANQIYVLLRKGADEEAKNLGKNVLTDINYSREADALIINYELARKRLNSKVSSDRLEELLEFTSAVSTKAAIYALLDKKKEMIENIKKEMQNDKTFRFTVARWPVFDKVRTNPDFMQAVSLINPAPLNSKSKVESITKMSASSG